MQRDRHYILPATWHDFNVRRLPYLVSDCDEDNFTATQVVLTASSVQQLSLQKKIVRSRALYPRRLYDNFINESGTPRTFRDQTVDHWNLECGAWIITTLLQDLRPKQRSYSSKMYSLVQNRAGLLVKQTGFLSSLDRIYKRLIGQALALRPRLFRYGAIGHYLCQGEKMRCFAIKQTYFTGSYYS